MNSIQHALKHHLNFIFNCIKNTKAPTQFLGNGLMESPKRQKKKLEIYVIQQNQEPSPQNTTGRKHKNFTNTAYHLYTASTIYKKKLECTSRNEIKKT
jgi:hypothetical protein